MCYSSDVWGGVTTGTSTVNLFTEMHLLNFKQVVSYVTCTYTFCPLSNPHFTQYFSYRSYVRSTREPEQSLLSLPAYSLVCYRGPDVYNRLPFAIRNFDNYNSFKV